MWILKNNNTGICLYITGEAERIITVGRLGSDLTLPNDCSISRTHAFLLYQNRRSQVLRIEDAGSLHGTYLNEGINGDTRLEKGVRMKLKDGDEVRFGRLQNIWCVTHKPLIVSTSMLPQEEAILTEEYVKALGGKVLPSWDMKCTHLTMREIVITVKLLHALLEEKPIVTSKYWKDMHNAVQKNQQVLPVAESYMPNYNQKIITYGAIESKGDMNRKRLFAGMTFVFLNKKHCEMYTQIVRKAGGISKDVNSGMKKNRLIEKNVVVVQYASSSESQGSQAITAIIDYLKENDRRIVPEYEIGMAIISCSTAKYCNPCYKILSDLVPSSMSPSQSPNTVLAQNTDTTNTEKTKSVCETGVLLVPETSEIGEEMEPMNLKLTESEPADVANLFVPDTDDEDEYMPSIRFTESNPPVTQHKRKRSTTQESDFEENEDNLFKFSKKSLIDKCVSKSMRPTMNKEFKKVLDKIENVEVPPPSKSPARETNHENMPLCSILLPRGENPRCATGFLEKSKPRTTATQKEKQNTATPNKNNETGKTPDGRKRARIPVLSDGEDDDLFNFGGKSYTNKRVRIRQIQDDESDEDILGMPSASKKTTDRAMRIFKPNCGEHSKPLPKVELKAKVNTAMPKAKVLPKTVDVSGWLHKINMKDGKLIKKEISDNVDGSSKDPQQWWHSLKGGFEVRKCSGNLLVRDLGNDKSDVPKQNEKMELDNANKPKNFKTFKKQQIMRGAYQYRPTPAPFI